MSAKHAPGCWRVELVTGSYKRPALVMSGDKVVAQCVGDQLTPDATGIGEAAANARLIAAAPDMLEALKDAHYALANIVEDTFRFDDDESHEQPCPYEELCGEDACNAGGCIRDKRDAARAVIAKAEGRTDA